ncbi:MAG: hypothetical protein QW035_03865 [Candidatus Anstonellales archaeon]
MTLEIPVISIKEKKAYTFSPIPSYLGNAVAAIKSLGKHFELIHIVDKDIGQGRAKNLDVYDASTYITHIQVEVQKKEIAEKLQKVEARCVVGEGFDFYGLDLDLLVADMRLSFYESPFRDVLVSEDIYLQNQAELKGKRIIGWGFSKRGFFGFIDIKKWEERSSFSKFLR